MSTTEGLLEEQGTAEPALRTTLEFNPQSYSADALRLILAKAQEWECSPAEAQGRLLDELARTGGKRKRSH